MRLVSVLFLLATAASAQTLGPVGGVTVYGPPSDPTFIAAHGAVYFSGSDTGGVPMLWRTDGTASGTVRVSGGAVQPSAWWPYDERLYFVARPAIGEPTGLYRTAANGLSLERVGAAEGVTAFAVVGGSLFFSATTEDEGAEPWRGDAAAQGPLADICAGPCSSEPAGFTATPEGVVVFAATDRFTGDTPAGRELWRAEAAGASLVADLDPSGSSDPAGFARVGGTVYFTAEGRDANGDDVGRELFTTNGTDVGTGLVVDHNPGDSWSGIRPLGSAASGSVWGVFTNGGYEPHTLGEDGFVLLGDLNGRSGGSLDATMCGPDPDRCNIAEAVGGWLYFAAEPGVSRRRLFATDGASVVEVATPEGVDVLSAPTRYDGGLALVGCDDGRTACALYRLDAPDGTPTLLAPFPEGATAFAMEAHGDALLLQVAPSRFALDYELWAYTPAGATAPEAAPEAAPLALRAFPSPAAGPVSLRYTLAAPAPVRLTVHDALGRAVAVVEDGARAAGTHTATWDPGALPAGVYVVRLGAGAAHAARAVVVAR